MRAAIAVPVVALLAGALLCLALQLPRQPADPAGAGGGRRRRYRGPFGTRRGRSGTGPADGDEPQPDVTWIT